MKLSAVLLLLAAVLIRLPALNVGDVSISDWEAQQFHQALIQGFPEYGKDRSGLEAELVSLEVKEDSSSVMMRARMKLIYKAYTRDLKLIGQGKSREAAAADLAGYLARVLPSEVVSIPGLMQGPRIEHIGQSQVFIYSPNPISRGGAEFTASSPDGTALLRVRSTAYWRSRDEQQLQEVRRLLPEEENPWHHYLPADVLYTDAPLRAGTALQVHERFGVSLTVRTGYRYPAAAEITADAVFDALFDFWQPLLRVSLEYDVQQVQIQPSVMAGWKFTVMPRLQVTEEVSVLHRMGAGGVFAAGWEFGAGQLILSLAGEVLMFASPRYIMGAYAGATFRPASDDLNIMYALHAGLSVTYRL